MGAVKTLDIFLKSIDHPHVKWKLLAALKTEVLPTAEPKTSVKIKGFFPLKIIEYYCQGIFFLPK